MGGQIARRKRKGRPKKPDLSRSGRSSAPESGTIVRRSRRRRNARYSNFIDYDDFIEDDFEVEEEEEEEEGVDGEEWRRGRKVKLVMKLSQQRARGHHERESESGDSGSGREEEEDKQDAGAAVAEDGEEESERRMVKKRRIHGREDEDDMDDRVEGDYCGRGKEDSGRKGNSRGHESPPGTPPDSLSEVPWPDKKTLELILDKLQKKDIYGVYAEPVDPEELPDYHDIIENPMDFSTVRKKLVNGSYATLSQFESDVFLICINAMQYNAPDTVYHEQARNIQELGRKKFLKLRIKYERSLKETNAEQRLENDQESSDIDLKSDQGVKSNLSMKKMVKKPLSRSTQESVSSDFSGGAMPATTGDLPCNSAANQGGYDERHSINERLMDGNVASAENLADKAEEVFRGRGFSSRLGQKPFVLDENRRAAYAMSSHPAVESNSIFTTFEGEIRQLVAVGLQAEYSYASSLARFAGSLGPIAWKFASQWIEQSLPSDCKFGRGWIVEYEPVSTPIIFTPKSSWEFPSTAKILPLDIRHRKEGLPFKMFPSAKKDAVLCSAREATQSSIFHGNSLGSPGSSSMKNHHISSPRLSNRAKSETKAFKQFELNSLPSMPHNNGDVTHAPEEKIPGSSRVADLNTRESTPVSINNPQPEIWESAVLRSRETSTASVNTRQMLPFAQLDGNGIPGNVPNRRVPKICLDSSKTISPCTGLTNKMPVPPFNFPRQDQGLSDPVQIMRLLSAKAQGQQTPSNPADSQQVMQSAPSVGREAFGNIAGSWMSISAGGIKLPMRSSEAQKIQTISPLQYHVIPQQAAGVHGSEFPVSSGIQFQAEKNGLPFRGLAQTPAFAFNEARFRPQAILSPHSIPAEFSRFQAHSLWQGVTPSPPMQPRLKLDNLPPDLNIGFHSLAFPPVKPSPGIMVDSQQPDLALQL